jgi:hypothetical protein
MAGFASLYTTLQGKRKFSCVGLLEQFFEHCRVRSAHQYLRKSTGAQSAPYIETQTELGVTLFVKHWQLACQNLPPSAR